PRGRTQRLVLCMPALEKLHHMTAARRICLEQLLTRPARQFPKLVQCTLDCTRYVAKSYPSSQEQRHCLFVRSIVHRRCRAAAFSRRNSKPESGKPGCIHWLERERRNGNRVERSQSLVS